MVTKKLLNAVSVFCLAGCAVPGPSFLQTASTLPRGGIRLQEGVGTGLHFEETAYRKLNPDQIQTGGEPNKDQAYQRDFMIKPGIFHLFYLGNVVIHGAYGLREGWEPNGSLFVSLASAGGRLALKARLYQDATYALSINPGFLAAFSYGGKSPDEEDKTGQDSFLQYVLNDKRVLGLELPLLASVTSGKIIYTAIPSVAYYDVDISKGFAPAVKGTSGVLGAGLGFSLQLRLKKARFGPEISLSALDLTHQPIVNANYGLGGGIEF